MEIRRHTVQVVELVADRRLYLTSDQARVVEEGSLEAAFLLAAAGSPIPAELAARFGLELKDGRVTQRTIEEERAEGEVPAPAAEEAPAPAEEPEAPKLAPDEDAQE